MNLSLYEIILSRTDNSRRRLISCHAAACNIRFDVAPTEYPVVHNSFSSLRIAQISFLVYFSSDTILPYTSPSSIGILHNKSVHNLCITTIYSTDNVNFSPPKKLRHPAGSDVPAHRKSLRPPQSRYYRLFLLKNIIAFESMMCYTES